MTDQRQPEQSLSMPLDSIQLQPRRHTMAPEKKLKTGMAHARGTCSSSGLTLA